MDFRPLEKTEQNRLREALRGNGRNGADVILMGRDTSFLDKYRGEVVEDAEVVNAIRSIPTHF